MFTQQYPLYFPTPRYATLDIISRLLWVLQAQPQCDLDDIFHCEDLVKLEEIVLDDIFHCEDLVTLEEIVLDDIFHCEDLVTMEEIGNWLQLSDDYSVTSDFPYDN